MTLNETIARWCNYKWRGGYTLVVGDDGEVFLETPLGAYAGEWSPDTDITLWHGPDGLLAKIEEKRMRGVFLGRLSERVVPISHAVQRDTQVLLWRVLTAAPAQLAGALAEVIGDDG